MQDKIIRALTEFVLLDEPIPQSVVRMGKIIVTDFSDCGQDLSKLTYQAAEENRLLKLLEGLDILNMFRMYSMLDYVPQSPVYHPEGHLGTHMQLVMAEAREYDVLTKLGALVHDFGKPVSYLKHGNTYDHHSSGLPYIERFCALMGISELAPTLMTACEYHIRAHSAVGKNRLSARKLLDLLTALEYDKDNDTFDTCLNIFTCDLKGRGGERDISSVTYLRAARDTLLAVKDESHGRKLTVLKYFVARRDYTHTNDKVHIPTSKHVGEPQRQWLHECLEEAGLDVVALMIVGSRGQGIDTVNSDTDVMCIYRPGTFDNDYGKVFKSDKLGIELAFRSVLQIPKAMRSIDINTLDMLYAGTRALLYSTVLWDNIVSHRKLVLTSEMQGMTRQVKCLADGVKRAHEHMTDYRDLIALLDGPDVPVNWEGMAENSFHLKVVHGSDASYIQGIGKKKYKLTKSKDEFKEILHRAILEKHESLAKSTKRSVLTHALRSAITYSILVNSNGETIELPDPEKEIILLCKKATDIEVVTYIGLATTYIHGVTVDVRKYPSVQDLSPIYSLFGK